MTKTQKRLLLFDIDGTLIHSGGAGVQALIRAFKERFGIDDDLSDIEIAGMTDSGIVVSIKQTQDTPNSRKRERVPGQLCAFSFAGVAAAERQTAPRRAPVARKTEGAPASGARALDW